MIRLNTSTPSSDVQGIKVGDEVTNTFQKSGKVTHIEILDKGNRIEYIFTLANGKKILIAR